MGSESPAARRSTSRASAYASRSSQRQIVNETQTINGEGVDMSNRFSVHCLTFPGDDTRLDLTDVFAFKSVADPGKTVLIINSNPTLRPPVELPSTVIARRNFHPRAVYRINVDNDGDAHADVAFTFTFYEPGNGMQSGTAHFASAPQARPPVSLSPVLTS